MELVWKELEAVRLVTRAQAVLPVRAELPLPDGRKPAEALSCCAAASVASARAEADAAQIEGVLTVRVSALDTNGVVFAFESASEFTHGMDAVGAEHGMEANAEAVVRSARVLLTDGGAALEAELELSVEITSSAPLRVIDGVKAAHDLEVKSKKYVLGKRRELGSRTLRMREELAEAGAAEVLSCSGQVYVREAVPERDGVAVSGVLTLSAVTADSLGRPCGLIRQIPFREKLDIPAFAEGVYCKAQLNELGLHALGEEFSLLAMDAEITFNLYAIDKKELVLPVDAYSPGIGFDCVYEDAELVRLIDSCSIQAALKETLELPVSVPELEEALYAEAQPLITSVETGEGRITVSGVLTTTVVYESYSGAITSYTEDVPFSTELPNGTDGCSPRISCGCAVQVTGGSERTLQLNYALQLDLELYGSDAVRTVAGLAEKELPPRKSGLIIAFASEDDGWFDIGRRCGVSIESVMKLNPGMAEPFREGDRLLVMV